MRNIKYCIGTSAGQLWGIIGRDLVSVLMGRMRWRVFKKRAAIRINTARFYFDCASDF